VRCSTRAKTQVVSERSARKEPMSDAEVKSLLGKVKTVIVAKGKSARTLEASKVKTADLKGPTGNFRAPMVLKGSTLLVGFHEESLKGLL